MILNFKVIILFIFISRLKFIKVADMINYWKCATSAYAKWVHPKLKKQFFIFYFLFLGILFSDYLGENLARINGSEGIMMICEERVEEVRRFLEKGKPEGIHPHNLSFCMIIRAFTTTSFGGPFVKLWLCGPTAAIHRLPLKVTKLPSLLNRTPPQLSTFGSPMPNGWILDRATSNWASFFNYWIPFF